MFSHMISGCFCHAFVVDILNEMTFVSQTWSHKFSHAFMLLLPRLYCWYILWNYIYSRLYCYFTHWRSICFRTWFQVAFSAALLLLIRTEIPFYHVSVHKCVQRELQSSKAVPLTAERFGVQTHYYRLPMWSVMRVTKHFVSTSNFISIRSPSILQAEHDSFCALGTLWCRF